MIALVNVLILSCSATYLNIRVPLTTDHSGNFLADGFDFSTNTSVRVPLLLGESLYYETVSPSSEIDEFIEFEGFLPNSSRASFRVRSSTLRFSRADSSLHIGSVSSLTREVGSVAIVRHGETSSLVVGSTMDQFIESCVPDSIVHFQLNSELLLPDGVFALVGFNGFPFRTMGFTSDPLFVLTAPEGIVAGITETLISLGAIRLAVSSPRSSRFSNCSSELTLRLPDISLMVSNATLVFYPDDYMRFHDDGDCDLRIRSSFSNMFSYISPMIMTGFNFRVSSDQTWAFCDPA